jgi:hypothetical protein
MKIYIGHSSAFDYKRLLYFPLQSSALWQQHSFMLPHEHSSDPADSKTVISNADLVIAEVSYPSTGLGIELGWAHNANRKILCLHQQNTKPSSSLSIICDQFIHYSDSDDLINQLTQWLGHHMHYQSELSSD